MIAFLMENSIKKSGAVEIPKRKRSLDLQSLYRTRASQVGETKKKVSREKDQHNSTKKTRTSQKEVSLSCFESDAKKRRKEDGDGVNSELGFSQKSSGVSKGVHGTLLALGKNGNAFNFPKRRRGSVGQNKLEADRVSKQLGLPNPVDRGGAFNAKLIKPKEEAATADQLVKLVSGSAGNGRASNSKSAGKAGGSNSKVWKKAGSKPTRNINTSNLKLKEKARPNELKDRNGRLSSIRRTEKEYSVAVNNRDISSKKRRTNGGKKKDLVDGRDGGEASKKKSGPSAGNTVSDGLLDFDEDDENEENLEENAARMLSSRFDPSCTGFSSKRKISSSQKANESSLRFSSTREANSSGSGGVESASADDTSRALRPRSVDKGKEGPRKRRHFYENLPTDLEPLWFLNRRIKVFWPLDESWYYGLVNDYHSEFKLHHIKYDDRDEEWVDLQEEKFKLLLFPSEVPGRAKSKKVSKGNSDIDKVEKVPPETDDRCSGNNLDSEPIALWLARSSLYGKSLKTPRTSDMGQPIVSSSSSEGTGDLNSKMADSNGTRSYANCESTSADNLMLGTLNGNCVVYVRKKSQKKCEAYGSAAGTVNTASVTFSLPTAEENKFYYGFVDPDKQLWSMDCQGKLRLNVRLVESEKIRFQISITVLPFRGFSIGTGYFWLLHNILIVQHGAILPTSPAVSMEILFMDKYLGLRFLLFEGCMKLALAFVFQILTLFSQPDELMNAKVQSPVTSMRFRISSVYDLRKYHIFEFHYFFRLPSSKWVCLESKLVQHCIILKQLSVAECTYDNIKELEYRSLRQCRPNVGLEPSLHVGFNKLFMPGILPMGVSQQACTRRISQPALKLAQKLGRVPQFVISFSAVPTFFLTLHLQMLMENSFAPEVCAPAHQLEPDLHEQTVVSLPSVATSIPSLTSNHRSEVDIPLDGKSIYRQAADVDYSINKGSAHNHIPAGSALGNLSSMCPNGGSKFMHSGFSNGPKKPRTQVHYTLPGAGYDFSSKQKMQNQTTLPCKRIRRASLKRISDVSMGNQKNFELLACGANVLVTHGNKGWRESGALIVMEVADNNEWKLAVKLSGLTKYSFKVKHILQPGSTNRYSHAVLWKGGKDLVLEFPDRSQWNLFKEMHEECYNRNIRAASVKNIPIPGVQLIEESDDCGSEVPFVRNSTKYFRQGQTDVEMAMDPSCILYDMDSDDEQWLMANKNFNDKNRYEEVSHELLEKTMDMFEKVSYVQHRIDFTDSEIQELVVGIGPVEAAKVIYEHWREKRGRKGMPLIRHLQPPLWERYQEQLKERENTVARGKTGISVGIQEKVSTPEEPAMFAFCLKPEGLDVPNKGSKQRSHRKFPVSGHLHAASGDHDSSNFFGRRSNGYTFGDEKVIYTSSVRESSYVSPSVQASKRVLSPRDANFSLSTDMPKSNRKMKLYKNKPRKVGRPPSSNNQQTVSYNRRTKGNRNGVQRGNMSLTDSSSQRHYYLGGLHKQGMEHLNVSDLNELQARDASHAAQRALNIAKLKRQKAHRLFHKVDLAIHKAAVALMTAEAIKSTHENSSSCSNDC